MTACTHQSLSLFLSHSRAVRRGVLFLALLALCPPIVSAQTTARVLIQKDKSAPAKLSYFFRTGARADFNPTGLPADKTILLDVNNDFLAPDTILFLVDDASQRVAQFPLPALIKEQKRINNLGLLDPNLLPNGTFQSGTSHWQKLPTNSDLALATKQAQTGIVNGQALELKIGAKAEAGAALATDPVTLVDNRDYVLRFAARTDKPRSVRFALRLDGSDETAGLNEDKTISTEWQTYELPLKSLRTSSVSTPQRVLFVYEGDAKKVCLAGNFNNWSESANLMERDPNSKKWRLALNLKPGTFEYKFIVDGAWTSDINAPMKAEGNHNSVVQVGSTYPVRLMMLPGKGAGSIEIGAVSLQLRRIPKFAVTEVNADGDAFRLASSVSIPVRLSGRPVGKYTVSLQVVGAKSEPVTARPDDTGTVTFKNVPLNSHVTLTVRGDNQLQYVVKDEIKNEGKTTLGAITLPAEWSKAVTFLGPPPVTLLAGTTAPKEEGNNKLFVILGVVAGALLVTLGGLMYSVNTKRKQEMALLPSAVPVSGRIASATAVVPLTMTTRQPVSVLADASTVNQLKPEQKPSVRSVQTFGIPQLTGIHGTYNGYEFALNGEISQIGRDITSTVALPQDSNVSRCHATLHSADGEYILTDEGSSNGTFVNGQRIPSNTPHPLNPGDEVEFGSSRFRFEA